MSSKLLIKQGFASSCTPPTLSVTCTTTNSYILQVPTQNIIFNRNNTDFIISWEMFIDIPLYIGCFQVSSTSLLSITNGDSVLVSLTDILIDGSKGQTIQGVLGLHTTKTTYKYVISLRNMMGIDISTFTGCRMELSLHDSITISQPFTSCEQLSNLCVSSCGRTLLCDGVIPPPPTQTITQFLTDGTFSIPSTGASLLVVKLWGAGGQYGDSGNVYSSGATNVGGGGGYAQYELTNPTPNATYNITVGIAGSQTNQLTSVLEKGGWGGGMTMLHLQNGGNFDVKAVAGGGGGAGAVYRNNAARGRGGPGGRNGNNGDNPGSGADPTGGIAGLGGVGGAGGVTRSTSGASIPFSGSIGEDFINSVSDLSLVGGRGGLGGWMPTISEVAGGSGGAGYGGGGGGGATVFVGGSSVSIGAGGGGGGNYSESGFTALSTGRQDNPANRFDSDYIAPLARGGYLNFTGGGTRSRGGGTDGFAVVIICT